MNLQKLQEHFRGRQLINVVMDGYGIGKPDETNAMHQAKLPVMEHLLTECANTQLFAHGHHVGLPSDSDLGGSEVGHMTMGAGKTLEQGPTYIQRLIKSGELFKSDSLVKIIKNCVEYQTPLHLLGLLSDGNIHSNINHALAIIKHAFEAGIKRVYVHALLDGRDVPIQSALEYTEPFEKLFNELKQQRPDIDYAFASGGGREAITMDRDKNWDKVEDGWNIHVRGKCDRQFKSIEEAILTLREEHPHIIDQALPGFVIVRDGKPVGIVEDNHSFVFFNFRADRAIQFAKAIVEDDFPYFDRSPRPKVMFAGMMIYDQDTQLPENHIVGPTKVDNPFGKIVLEAGMNQFRLTETQKFPHVTFFFNGGYRDPLDPKKENYYLINSDKLPSFDLKPEMKAIEISQKAVEFIKSKEYNYGLINFANADMVGHSGNMEAAIKAVEIVDSVLAPIMKAIDEVSGILVITADHGNADEMLFYNKNSKKWEPNTKHSINPVPYIIYDPLFEGQYQLKSPDAEVLNLSNIAATNCILLGLPIPSDINDPLLVL